MGAGWAKDETNGPVLEDFGAYVSLMAESTRDYLDAKYPQFVSFVGETSEYMIISELEFMLIRQTLAKAPSSTCLSSCMTLG